MKLEYLKDSSKDITDKKRKRKIRTIFMLSVFVILLATYLMLSSTLFVLVKLDVLHVEMLSISNWLLLLIFFVASFVIGSILTIIVSKLVLGTVNTVAEGMSALSKGNYDVRLDLGKGEEAKQLADGFNKLAQELKGTQMLRSNFVNEYAHEFKTPIVSIKGFAEILKQQDLTEAQRQEYLDVIIEEADRLTTLSTNSLNLSRIEEQRILSEKTTFNLSEQIRNSILLLENKWQQKHIDFSISIDEYNITANEEMLKQVWINLAHNAIKFSNDGGVIDIELYEEDSQLVFNITNGGTTIDECDYQKIFEKFYRAKSGGSGHGVGLAVVKKIVELHSGRVSVLSENDRAKFTVKLPQ